MKHTISVLVENHFGVLARVAGLFSARGFNIDSLAVGETQDPSVSRMTIVSHGDDRVLEQIVKQLSKLIDVIKVVDLGAADMIDRELVLAKVEADSANRGEIMQIVSSFRAKIMDVNNRSMTIEVTGGEGKVDAMLELLRPYGLLEVVRTGVIAISRKSEIEAPSKARAASESKSSNTDKKEKAKAAR